MIYRIELPAGLPLLNANHRMPPVVRDKMKATIRETARQVAIQQQIPKLERVRVRAIYYYPDNRNRDPGNMVLSVKPLIDGGLVDSQVIPDDNDTYLIDDGISRGNPNVKGGQLVLEVIEDKNVKVEWNVDIRKRFLGDTVSR